MKARSHLAFSVVVPNIDEFTCTLRTQSCSELAVAMSEASNTMLAVANIILFRQIRNSFPILFH